MTDQLIETKVFINDIVEKQDSLVLFKPTINELLNSFINDNNKEQLDILRNNERYLSLMEYKDYDQTNFNKLIASIELNGKKHFNMITFLAEVDLEEAMNSGYGTDEIYALDSDYMGSMKNNMFYKPVVKSTNTFNCNTVGCIAGFATANATNWNEDIWNESNMYHSDTHILMEHIACNFLNIPLSLGKKIFYGRIGCLWGYLREISEYYVAYDKKCDVKIFSHLKLEDEDFAGHRERDYPSVELNSINSEMAVRALELIRDNIVVYNSMSEEFTFNPNHLEEA